MKSSFIIFILSLFVLTKAGLIHSSSSSVKGQLTSGEHEDLDALFDEHSDLEEEECICDEENDGNEEDISEGGNSTRVKRCGCGYGYCGCTAPAAAPPAGGGGGTGGKHVFVVPFPMPSPPAPAPVPAPAQPSQTIVLPPQPQIPQIPQQPYIPQTSLLNGNAGNACDRLRLILTLTNQLEGLKLIEIAGQCVVQLEK